MEDKKRIIIRYAGPIPELGNILGPILNPYNEKIETIGKLVAGAKKVYEVKDGNEILLTSKNYKTDNFIVEVEAKTDKSEKKVDTAPPVANETLAGKNVADTNTSDKKEEQKVVTTNNTVVNNTTTNKTETNKTETAEKSDFTKK